MLDDFRLRVFMMAAAENSFTRAAQHLGVSQPAVSQNIAELEKLLGVTLFNRSRGDVSLTPDGELFGQYVERILHWCALAEEKFMHKQYPPSSQSALFTLEDGSRAEVFVRDGAINIRFGK